VSPRLTTSTLILVASQAIYNGGMAIEVVLMLRWFESLQIDAYFYALSLASVFEVGVHWGSQHMVNREATARFEELNQRLPGLFTASLLTVLFVFLLIAGIEGPVLAVIACCALIRAGSTLLGAICIGRGHIGPPALARLLASGTGLLGLLLFVQPNPSLGRLAIVIGSATLAYVLPLVIASRRIGVRLTTKSAQLPLIWRQLAVRLWPFLFLFFCGQFLYRVDPAILTWIGDEGLVTRYSAAFKWVEGLFFLAYVVASATIPALVKATQGPSVESANRTLLQVAATLTAGTLCVAVALLFVGEPLLLWMVGINFAPSVPLFRVFAWLLPIHSLGVFLSAALVAFGCERRLLTITALAAAVGLAIKVPGFALYGIDLFVVGVFSGLIFHVLACAVALWRRPLAATA